MEIRFHLDEQIHTKLIQKIRDRAGNSHPSKAAMIMLIEYSYAEDMMILTASGQKGVNNLADSAVNSGELDMDDFDNFLDSL